MRIEKIGLDYKNEEGLNLALGFFDGMHPGHKKLIAETLDEDNIPAVLTFETDFKSKLFKCEERLLLTEEEKEKLLENLGVKRMYILPSTDEIFRASIGDFLGLLRNMNVKKIVVGEDYSFGDKGKGRVSDLYQLEEDGIRIIPVPILTYRGQKVSSSRIKKLLSEGEAEEVHRVLGYPFFISGKVMKGKHNGSTLGFPTANIAYPENKAQLKEGVYRTMAIVKGKTYRSMTNIGTHPTIAELKEEIIETHLFDYGAAELYGEDLQIAFLEYIRPQCKFDSIEELTKQLAEDKAYCKRRFDEKK